MRTNERIFTGCVVCMPFVFIFLAVASIPNPPRIIRPSFYNTKVEPDLVGRQSLGIFEVTAYCPCEKCCDEWSDGITASGYRIQPGNKFCAADPIIPFGKVLGIPGYGFVPVLDRGGLIRGKKLDVFFPNHAEALEWGRQYLEIHCWVERSQKWHE